MGSVPDGGAARFRFGEFTFDSGSRLLLRNGAVQHLSPKAQQLLQMLLLNRPNAVSREEIYDALWPSTFVSETNMATIVSELRRALGDDARSGQYIRTVHGFGYAFSADMEMADPRPLFAAILYCEGERYLLYEGENTVGRAPDCRVVLTAPTVSRHHAVLLIAGSTIHVEDLGSTNGTYVNGQRVRYAQIRTKDAIGFGAMRGTISRMVSATAPFPLFAAGVRRQSSGSVGRP